MDKMKNDLKGKSYRNLDGMSKRIDSPFTSGVLECPLPSKFRLPQLETYDGHTETYDGHTNPPDHKESFKTLLNLQ